MLLTPADLGQFSFPKEILEKSTSDLIKYVIDLKRGNSAPVSLFRTKLMVVGDEKVGKTSLLEGLFPFEFSALVSVGKKSTPSDDM